MLKKLQSIITIIRFLNMYIHMHFNSIPDLLFTDLHNFLYKCLDKNLKLSPVDLSSDFSASTALWCTSATTSCTFGSVTLVLAGFVPSASEDFWDN